MRWLTGIVGFTGIVGVMAYPVRKQIYKRRAGPLRYWLLSHSYLGVIGGSVLLLHGGVQSGGALTTALMVSFDLVILTGLFGILVYYVAPRMLTRIEGQPLLIEDLLARREELRRSLARRWPRPRRRNSSGSVLKRCLSLRFLLRQYLRRESLDQLISAVGGASPRPRASPRTSREFLQRDRKGRDHAARGRADLPAPVVEIVACPHVILTSLMLALMIVHIIQVIYFLAR